MSLLSHKRLVQLVEQGVINAKYENINGASIDITLDEQIMYEISFNHIPVDLKSKECIGLKLHRIVDCGYILRPGDFILASSVETFNLPKNIAAEYKLKSSLARSGLQHLMAGWCDPGWNNSKLTLELKNVTKHHKLLIKPGMKIGQVVFWECKPVSDDQSYAAKGQYNGQETVTTNKGLR